MLAFVTTNEGKLREAREYLDGDVRQFDYDYPEIQSDDVGSVAAHGARDAYEQVGEPVIVDDAGLFVDGLDGFPGPYSSYVERTIGIERVWRLARDADARRASFRGVIAYCDGEGFEATPDPVDRGRRGQDTDVDDRATATIDESVHVGAYPVKLFEGIVPGRLVEPRGEGGFGYDPIFEYHGRTFAEMSPEEKNAVSHRGRALARFAEWYDGRQ